jgi:serine/threonine-protein kinase RsbT
LFAVSAADRRRQRELDAPRHLLECDVCGRVTELLVERSKTDTTNEVIEIRKDADIVTARQAVRQMASALGFARTDATVIATAVSEIARNIVRFAERGEMAIEVLYETRYGIQITARDVGPGIADVEQAITPGYSTYRGLGLGLPGARRLMDEFSVSSELGRGTTVTMIKWRKGRDDE